MGDEENLVSFLGWQATRHRPAMHLQGYSVKFSPFEDDKLAVATSQNFGIIGNGKQYVLQVRARTAG